MKRYIFFIIKWIGVPVVLLSIYFFLAFLFSPYEPFSIVTYPQNSNDTINSNIPLGSPLFKGDKVYGQFTARDNNLGILVVRFWNFKHISKDVLQFRIKELGKKDWYYTWHYKVDQFQPNEYFTFGFPIIDNSKGKTYQFELESTAGKQGDAIGISKVKPYFGSRYKFFFSENKKNPIAISQFVFEKIIDLFSDPRSLLLSAIYLFPLVAYITFTFILNEKIGLKIFYPALFIYIFSLVGFDKFTYLPLMAIITVLLYWTYGIIRYHLESSVNFFFAILFLILTALVSSENYASYVAEKLGVFFYWFLLFGVIERLLEIKIRKKFRNNYKSFLKLLIT